MNDFRLRPQLRTPAVGNDFRLIPGWDGDEAEANVGGTAVAANPLASGEIIVGFVVMVGGLAIASNAVALGATAIHRTAVTFARARWFPLSHQPTLVRARWFTTQTVPVTLQGRMGSLKPLPVLKRALWVGMHSIQQVVNAVWVPFRQAGSGRFRAVWPGLSPQHRVSRIRWGSFVSGQSNLVRAKLSRRRADL